MHGGGGKGFNITSISGLSLPENDVATVRYPNVAGQIVTKSNPMERIITISADVKDENGKYISEAAAIFSKKGMIYITSFGKTKKIEARCVSFEPNKRKGAYVPVTIQFCADDPYFCDIYETKVQIFNRFGVLSSPFVLGCMLSERRTKRDIINRGDVPIEPVFEITSEIGTACPEGISIKNITSGKTILLNTDILQGETITVDIEKRKITSNVRGNIILCLDQYSSLSDFYIDRGISTIEVDATDSNGTIFVSCSFNNRYISVLI